MNQSAANSPNDFVSIPIAAELKRNNLDLIAFVEDKNGRVLQTLKLPLH